MQVSIDPFTTKELSAEQVADLNANIELCRDAILFFTSCGSGTGYGGHTGGAFDTVPEVPPPPSTLNTQHPAPNTQHPAPNTQRNAARTMCFFFFVSLWGAPWAVVDPPPAAQVPPVKSLSQSPHYQCRLTHRVNLSTQFALRSPVRRFR